MGSGKLGCAPDMVYGVVRLNEKTAPQGITSAVFLGSPLWIILKQTGSYPVRTVNYTM